MVSAKLPAQSSISGLPSSKSNTDKVRPLSIAKPAGSTLTSTVEAASTSPGDLAPDLGYGRKVINSRMVPRGNVGTGRGLQEEKSGYPGCQRKDPDRQPITVF